MNKITTIFLTTGIIPIVLACIFMQEIATSGLIYLHKQKKTGRSNVAHLEKFTASGDIVLDFYADWCNPCQRMSSLIDYVVKALPQFTFIKINRDFFADLASTFNVTSIPTLIFLRNGKEIGRYDGKPLTKKELKRLVKDIYSK